jgi:hypothetical protein
VEKLRFGQAAPLQRALCPEETATKTERERERAAAKKNLFFPYQFLHFFSSSTLWDRDFHGVYEFSVFTSSFR